MPAQRLGGETIAIRRYDIAGLDSATTPEFIRHVGLAGEEREQFNETDKLVLVHMGPPLERGGSTFPISCMGTVSLTVDETRQIDVFVDELELEYEAARLRKDHQYVIAPHFREKQEKDGTTTFRRFNCAGFVIEAYREAGIILLRTDPESLPSVPLEILTDQYPDVGQLLQNPRFRERNGIPGDGPWPVVLSSYVLNALARPEEEIRSRPHMAEVGDEFFPSRRANPTSAAPASG
jgi:hypothetical protein